MARSRNSFSRRLYVVAFACALPLGGMGWRMYNLSVVDGPEMDKQVRNITCGETVKMSYRGPILDRNGAALATSVEAYRVSRSGRQYRYDPAHAAVLAPLLDMSEAETEQKLRSVKDRFIWMAKDISGDAARAIERAGIHGVGVHNDQLRSYPHGPLAAHVVGFAGADAQGLEGVELALDNHIRGEAVSVQVCSDAQGRTRLDAGDMAGINKGATVELTIDATLQSIAERELALRVEEMEAQAGTVVMMDPRTGEVLALANLPVFDPNRYSRFPVSWRRNRALTDLFDPGSTTKPLLVAAAMQAGVINRDSTYDCEHGALRIGRRIIHDHKPHDVLDIADILRVSSNICSAKIGADLGAERLHDFLRKYSFGRRSGLELPGESPGLLRPASSWRAIDLANVSFGQGVSVTALQLTSAFSVLANGGVRMQPFLVARATLPDGTVVLDKRPTAEQAVVSAEIAREVTGMLEAVVSLRGTAPQAMIEGLRIAGKTGTAQKVVDGKYSRKHWVSSFVGYLPAEDPRLVIAVVIDEPQKHHYGGVVAGPVFKRIAEASLDYLHIHRSPVAAPPQPDGEPAFAPPGGLRETLQRAGFQREWLRAPDPKAPVPGTPMPDLRGLSLRAAMRVLGGCECEVEVDGSGYVRSQDPAPGATLEPQATVKIGLEREREPAPRAARAG